MESRGFLIVVLDNKSPGSLPHLQALDPGGALPACGPTFAIWRLAAKPSLGAHDHSPCGEYTRRRADRGSSPQCRRQRPGTFNIVVAARDAGEACRHLLGGDAILSHAALPVHEAMKAQPITPYARRNWRRKPMAHAFAGAYRMKVTSLRFSNIYGSHSRRKRSPALGDGLFAT